MRKFNQTATISNAKIARGGKLGKYSLAGVLALLIMICAWYGVYSFFQKYRVQSPVVFRPAVVKREAAKFKQDKPSKPRSKVDGMKKAIIPQVEASEPQIESFPKYLTDQGAINRTHVLSYLEQQGYDQDNITAMDNIFKKESGYRADALNEIGAGGVCQSYPFSKMGCQLTTEDLMCQVDWCLGYVKGRYGTPVEAWNFHEINNWF